MQTVRLRNDRLYLVESKEDSTVRLALAPECRDGEMMCWLDTQRPRMKPGRLEASTPTSARFRGVDGALYVFRVCSLQDYVTHMQPFVEAAPTFATEEALHRFYVDNFG